MGKHDNGASYARVKDDFYPSPDWVVEALCEFVRLRGRWVWEPACGDGRMALALRRAGARVYASDIVDRGYAGLNKRFDFAASTATSNPKVIDRDPVIITNPPMSEVGKSDSRLAMKFIEAGLRRTEQRGSMALLLPPDFDSGVTRTKFFADCPRFAGKIVLLDRPVWFSRSDGGRAAPKENRVWFLWSHDPERTAPVILYARTRAPRKERQSDGLGH